MKFNDYMHKKHGKTVKSINESSNVLNEAGTEDFTAIIKGVMAYTKAMSMISKYEKAAQEGDSNFIKAKTLQKTGPIESKAGMLRLKAEEADREAKKKMLAQATALDTQADKIKDTEATVLQQKADEFTNIKTDFDEAASAVAPESLKSIVSKKKTLADQAAKIRGLKAMEAALSTTKDKARQEKLKAEMQAADDRYNEAMKALDDAEDAGEDDMQEVEGVKAVEPELKAFMAAGKAFKSERAKLVAVYDEADALASKNEDEEYVTRSSEEMYELFIAELEMNEDELFEEDDKSVTPQMVLGKINTCDDEEKPALYAKLKTALAGYKKAKMAQIEAKKKIWEKVAGKPSTKSVLLVAGATEDTITEEEKDGKTVYTASEPGAKWKAAFENPESEDGPLAGVVEVEKKLEELGSSEPAADDTSEPAADDTKGEDLSAAKEALTKAEKELSDAESDENVGQDEVNARKENVEKAKQKVKDLETKDESVASNKVAEDDKPADNKPAEAATKKIMKFEDFMASKK
jgi:hypothetical protein